MDESSSTAAPHQMALQTFDLGIRLPKGRGVRRLFSEGHWAFKDVSVSIRRGETLAILGRNGSGKSTLLKTLAGILEPDIGRIEYAPNLTTAILAPGAGFDPGLTGRENIYATALYHQFLPKEIDAKIDGIVEFSQLGTWIDQPIAIYSAGMRARLGFSLSLYLPADILMIDESLSAGDVDFREKSQKAIEDLAASDRTVILISHNMPTIRSMCPRAIVLDQGRMLGDGETGAMIELYTGVVRKTKEQAAAAAKDVAGG